MFSKRIGFILGTPLLLTCLGSATNHVSQLLSSLNTPESREMAEAKLESEGRADREVEKEIADQLPTEIEHATDAKSVRCMARLAGALGISSAAPALTKRLEQDNTIYMSVTFSQLAHLANDPIARALVSIGDPSVPGLSKLLYSPDRKARYRAARALALIQSPLAVSKRELYLRTGTDAAVLAILSNKE